jgi:signal transduction histidine kinase
MNKRFLFSLAAPIVATSLLLLALAVGTAWYVQRLQRTVSDDLRANVSGMRSAEELEILLRESLTELNRFLITDDRRFLQALADFRPQTEHWLAEAERWSLSPRERELTRRVRASYDSFREKIDRLSQAQDPAVLRLQVRAAIAELTENVLAPTHVFLDLNEEEVEQNIADNQRFSSRLAWSLLLLGTFGSGAGLAAGVGIARGLSRSLVQLSVPIRAAAGQLDEVVGPVTFAGRDLKEMEGVLHSIAERIKEVVERLRRTEREVLRSEQLAAVGQMAAGMAHELRNPLTSMKILVQAAQEGGALSGRDLVVVEEEITRLERLVRHFFDFARPPRPDKKVLDIRALVDQCLASLAARATTAGTRLEFHRPAEVVNAAVDPGQFRQVLLNLLGNALDAVGGGGIVEVSLTRDDSGGMRLEVADNGSGLPPNLGERIFAPFTTTKETGLGLGLSICKRIAEEHGGVIAAANRPGGGAVFTVRLPGPEPAVSVA